MSPTPKEPASSTSAIPPRYLTDVRQLVVRGSTCLPTVRVTVVYVVVVFERSVMSGVVTSVEMIEKSRLVVDKVYTSELIPSNEKTSVPPEAVTPAVQLRKNCAEFVP